MQWDDDTLARWDDRLDIGRVAGFLGGMIAGLVALITDNAVLMTLTLITMVLSALIPAVFSLMTTPKSPASPMPSLEMIEAMRQDRLARMRSGQPARWPELVFDRDDAGCLRL